MISDLVQSTVFAGAENRNEMYRKEIIEVMQKQFSLAEDENASLLLLHKKILGWSNINTQA